MLTSNDITKIYDENFEKIYRYFYYKFLSKEIAEDLTSETFMEFVAGLKKENSSIQDGTKYLYGIAKNVYLMHLKQKYKAGPQVHFETEAEFGSIVDEYVEEIEETDTIEEIAIKFIIKLPDKQREIAQLRFIDKMDLKDICKHLNKNMNYVKTTQKRAIKSLKDIVACTPSLT